MKKKPIIHDVSVTEKGWRMETDRIF